MPDISMNSTVDLEINPEQVDDNNNNTEVNKKLEMLNIDDKEIDEPDESDNKSDTTIEATEVTESGDTHISQSVDEPTTSPSAMDGQGGVDEDYSDYVKSPLHTAWTLWFMNGDTKNQPQAVEGDDGWRQKLIQLYTFDTVEDFWSLFHHVQQPAKLRVKNDYMLFRKGVVPQWEDTHNIKGGSWKLVLPSKMRGTDLDRMWLETVLSLIGEAYGDAGRIVTGCYLQRRQKEDRIQIWTSEADLKEENLVVGKMLKDRLNLSQTSPIHYLKHEDTYGDNPTTQRHQSWSRKHKHNSLYQV